MRRSSAPPAISRKSGSRSSATLTIGAAPAFAGVRPAMRRAREPRPCRRRLALDLAAHLVHVERACRGDDLLERGGRAARPACAIHDDVVAEDHQRGDRADAEAARRPPARPRCRPWRTGCPDGARRRPRTPARTQRHGAHHGAQKSTIANGWPGIVGGEAARRRARRRCPARRQRRGRRTGRSWRIVSARRTGPARGSRLNDGSCRPARWSSARRRTGSRRIGRRPRRTSAAPAVVAAV